MIMRSNTRASSSDAFFPPSTSHQIARAAWMSRLSIGTSEASLDVGLDAVWLSVGFLDEGIEQYLYCI